MIEGETTSSRTLFATPAAGVTTIPAAILAYLPPGTVAYASAEHAPIATNTNETISPSLTGAHRKM
jgi:hypothetical protein